MVDVNAQLTAVDRAVTTRDVEGEPSHVQRLSQTYPSAIDDVWQAVTTAERIERWFLPITGDLQLGGRYQLVGNAGGEVLACTPPADGTASYRLSWAYGGAPDTFVTVTLTAEGPERTRLDLEHVAPVSAVPEEIWAQFGPAGTGIGWDSGLLGLALHLTDPAARPEDPAAWTLTEEGKSFMRGSADAWAAAQIADGGDPEASRAGAHATYLMYVGEAPGPM